MDRCRRWFSLTRVAAILIMLGLWDQCAAQELSAAARDPEGMRQAKRLITTFETAGRNPADVVFLQNFDENPNLTRRAFVVLVELSESENDPAAAAMLGKLCDVSAALAAERFSDHIPTLILETARQNNPDARELRKRYVAFLWDEVRSGRKLSAAKLKDYTPYDESYFIVDKAVDYSREQNAATGLYHTKALRYQVAYLLANFAQVSSEHGSFGPVQARLAAMGKIEPTAAELAKLLASERFSEEILPYYQRRLELEAGLVSKVVPELSKMPNNRHHFSWKLATLYLAAAWAASDQGQVSLLREMLEKADDEMSHDPEVSRNHAVLRYVLATLRYRMNRLEGYDPDQAQLIAEFEKAYAPLDQYQPMKWASVDATWFDGRRATRYWLDELARFPGSGPQVASLIKINETWYRWWETTLSSQASVDSEDRLLKWAYLDAFYSLGPNFFDQMTYRWVSFPEYLPDREEIEWAKSALEILPETMTDVARRETGAGFPFYDLSQAGLLPEMRARVLLSEARMSDVAAPQKVALLEQSLPLARVAANPTDLARHLTDVGREFKKLGLADRAISCWREAAQVSEKAALAESSFASLYLLAKEFMDQKAWAEAAKYAELATDRLEKVSPLVGARSAEARRWSQELATITSLTAQAHIAADSPEKALAALNLASQLQSAALQVEGNSSAKQDAEVLRQQERGVATVSEQVAKLEAQPASPLRDSLLANSRQVLAGGKAEYLSKSRELRQKHAALYSQALRFDPLDLPALQTGLPSDVAVLQFFPTEETLYTFLVTKDAFEMRSSPVSQRQLDTLVTGFMRALRRNVPNDAQVVSMSRELDEILIAPFANQLQSKSSLVLIPAGRLNGLPFACLSDPAGQPLAARLGLLQLARSSDLGRLSSQGAVKLQSVVAFANPTQDLPAAQAEGAAVVSLFPQGKLFQTSEATKANFLSHGNDAQVLHIATHGEWNLDDSLRNYLLMAGSEKIAQEEILQLPLDDTSLVILSACNTAMGEGVDSGYVASLAEAFWLAGAQSVVASLWAVDDASTTLLMETFYTRLQAGDNKAEALRAAQLRVRSEQKFEHPYYWAGFLLFGERN